jgi:glycosyltransferase involved in cell wall biosynthesis
MSRPTVLERVRQTRRLLREQGYDALGTRLRARAATLIAPAGDWRLRVAREHFVRAADIADRGWRLPPPLPAEPGEPLTIAWVTVPPGEGGGGFTTMFRLAASLEAAGHRCVVYLHDRHGWSMDQHRRTIATWWPWLGAEIRNLADGIEDAHAIFATSWETAYPVLTSPARGARMYLVQDYEPLFYGAGSESMLAEATYRFGFHGVTAGAWLADLLQREHGMEAEPFQFGCDLDRYRLEPDIRRDGVCFYARPSTTRRAFELGVAALDVFAEHHPEVEIHAYGGKAPRLPFPVTDHGVVTPEELNRIYNRCVAGLALSATNVSLVPLEMLGSGCIPVVNDAPQNRMVLDNDAVRYASATPFHLAAALSELVVCPQADRQNAARAAAASVSSSSWEDAGAAVERIVSDVIQRSATMLAGVP